MHAPVFLCRSLISFAFERMKISWNFLHLPTSWRYLNLILLVLSFIAVRAQGGSRHIIRHCGAQGITAHA